ncbi:hypothetical protein F5Y03DRAFT_398818 [Xylaria venustula]|nr:hypothetical protein F5Y03DRAFT_398818 [Xylaria venustula]
MAGNSTGIATSGGHDDTAETNEPDVGPSNLERFTPFRRLPAELRIMVWQFAMEEETRLVHLHARGCNLTKRRERRGCPRKVGPRLRIGGVLYEQVPVWFFIDHECFDLALRRYSIRFSVTQNFRQFRHQNFERRSTNIIMSPADILVSWYSGQLNWYDTRYFYLQFGPQARLVRNLIVCPWFDSPKYLRQSILFLQMLDRLVGNLGNIDALERLFFVGGMQLSQHMYSGRSDHTDEVESWYTEISHKFDSQVIRHVMARGPEKRLKFFTLLSEAYQRSSICIYKEQSIESQLRKPNLGGKKRKKLGVTGTCAN